MEGSGIREELVEEVVCFRKLHRTVLHHGTCAETTIQELAPLTPVVAIRSSRVKPLPSHPDSMIRTAGASEKGR